MNGSHASRRASDTDTCRRICSSGEHMHGTSAPTERPLDSAPNLSTAHRDAAAEEAEKRLLGHRRVGGAEALRAVRSRGGALHTPLRPDLARRRARRRQHLPALCLPSWHGSCDDSCAVNAPRRGEETHALRFVPRARHAPLRRRSARAEAELARREASAGGCGGTRTRSDCSSRSRSCMPQQVGVSSLLACTHAVRLAVPESEEPHTRMGLLGSLE